MTSVFKEKCSSRGEVAKQLSSTKFLAPDNPGVFHGRLYRTCPPAPVSVWTSEDGPRSDMEGPDWLTATEYQDTPSVLADKVERLAALLKLSKRTVIYSGAGISTSAGIGQAARTGGRMMKGGATTDAAPTPTHLALAALRTQGLVHAWIQQNHDGLPQKAGWPQEDLIEIHGSWYDPSNPVVCYDGSLRSDLYDKMRKEQESADLVLVIGTSLSGLNADKVAINPAKRTLTGKSLGTVIINLQQTVCDPGATLRIFAECDDFFEKLLAHLSLAIDACSIPNSVETRALVPYDRNGRKTDKMLMWLDFSKGQRVHLNPSHNCQEARQPVYQHIGASEPHTYRGSVRQPGAGEGSVIRYSPKHGGWDLKIDGVMMLLGGWWLEAASRGQLASIPVINMDPIFVENASREEEDVTQQANFLRPSVLPRSRKVSSDSGYSCLSSKSSVSRSSSISRRTRSSSKSLSTES